MIWFSRSAIRRPKGFLEKYRLKAPESGNRSKKPLDQEVDSWSLAEIREDDCTEDPEPFRFLDLPTEVRLEIYSYLVNVPERVKWPRISLGSFSYNVSLVDEVGRRAEEDYKRVHKETALTRRSLLLLCRQINAEFSSIFYRTSKVIIHRDRVRLDCFRGDWGAHILPWPEVSDPIPTRKIITRSDAAFFRTTYFRDAKQSTMSQIRHLDYDASIWDKFVWLPYEMWTICDQDNHLTTNIDFVGLHKLSRVLAKYKDSFPSLESVRLHGVGDVSNGAYRLGHETLGRAPSKIWEVANEGGRWEGVERAFGDVPTLQSGALHGWKISRKVVYSNFHVRYVEVTFRKPSALQLADSASQGLEAMVMPSLSVEYRP